MVESTSTISEGRTATISRCILDQQNVESCAKNVLCFVHCFCSKTSPILKSMDQTSYTKHKHRVGCTVALHWLGHAGSDQVIPSGSGCGSYGSYGIAFRLS